MFGTERQLLNPKEVIEAGLSKKHLLIRDFGLYRHLQNIHSDNKSWIDNQLETINAQKLSVDRYEEIKRELDRIRKHPERPPKLELKLSQMVGEPKSLSRLRPASDVVPGLGQIAEGISEVFSQERSAASTRGEQVYANQIERLLGIPTAISPLSATEQKVLQTELLNIKKGVPITVAAARIMRKFVTSESVHEGIKKTEVFEQQEQTFVPAASVSEKVTQPTAAKNISQAAEKNVSVSSEQAYINSIDVFLRAHNTDGSLSEGDKVILAKEMEQVTQGLPATGDAQSIMYQYEHTQRPEPPRESKELINTPRVKLPLEKEVPKLKKIKVPRRQNETPKVTQESLPPETTINMSEKQSNFITEGEIDEDALLGIKRGHIGKGKTPFRKVPAFKKTPVTGTELQTTHTETSPRRLSGSEVEDAKKQLSEMFSEEIVALTPNQEKKHSQLSEEESANEYKGREDSDEAINQGYIHPSVLNRIKRELRKKKIVQNDAQQQLLTTEAVSGSVKELLENGPKSDSVANPFEKFKSYKGVTPEIRDGEIIPAVEEFIRIHGGVNPDEAAVIKNAAYQNMVLRAIRAVPVENPEEAALQVNRILHNVYQEAQKNKDTQKQVAEEYISLEVPQGVKRTGWFNKEYVDAQLNKTKAARTDILEITTTDKTSRDPENIPDVVPSVSNVTGAWSPDVALNTVKNNPIARTENGEVKSGAKNANMKFENPLPKSVESFDNSLREKIASRISQTESDAKERQKAINEKTAAVAVKGAELKNALDSMYEEQGFGMYGVSHYTEDEKKVIEKLNQEFDILNNELADLYAGKAIQKSPDFVASADSANMVNSPAEVAVGKTAIQQQRAVELSGYRTTGLGDAVVQPVRDVGVANTLPQAPEQAKATVMPQSDASAIMDRYVTPNEDLLRAQEDWRKVGVSDAEVPSAPEVANALDLPSPEITQTPEEIEKEALVKKIGYAQAELLDAQDALGSEKYTNLQDQIKGFTTRGMSPSVAREMEARLDGWRDEVDRMERRVISAQSRVETLQAEAVAKDVVVPEATFVQGEDVADSAEAVSPAEQLARSGDEEILAQLENHEARILELEAIIDNLENAPSRRYGGWNRAAKALGLAPLMWALTATALDNDHVPQGGQQNAGGGLATATQENAPAKITQEACQIAAQEAINRLQGMYTVKPGDNMWDISEGQTSAMQPRIFGEVAPDKLQATIDLTRDFLNAHPEVAKRIGFTVDGNVGLIYPGDQLNIATLDTVGRAVATNAGFKISGVVAPEIGKASTASTRPMVRPSSITVPNVSEPPVPRPETFEVPDDVLSDVGVAPKAEAGPSAERGEDGMLTASEWKPLTSELDARGVMDVLKRVEILGALKEYLKNNPEADVSDASRLNALDTIANEKGFPSLDLSVTFEKNSKIDSVTEAVHVYWEKHADVLSKELSEKEFNRLLTDLVISLNSDSTALKKMLTKMGASGDDLFAVQKPGTKIKLKPFFDALNTKLVAG